MTRRGFHIRMAISIALDLIDLTFGHIPGLGTVEDGIDAGLTTLLWGPVGLAYLWELADITDFIDGFVPTATLIGLYVGWRQGYVFAAKETSHEASPDRPGRGGAEPRKRPRRLPDRRA